MIKKKQVKYGDALSKTAYSRLVGVHPSRITALLHKLDTVNVFNKDTMILKQQILHTKNNEKLFDEDKIRNQRKGNRGLN